ncbi:MAG: hypothetical protein ACKOFG_10710 [Limnohabitans sp.]
MKTKLEVRLNLQGDQISRLQALQEVFVQACNFLAPLVAQTRCWNRVGLHHLAYRQLRERFPQLGSQMACNVIYSVSRAARKVYQAPGAAARFESQLPQMRFLPNAPVFFDRHTLSLKAGRLSLFTLDGRLKFQLNVSPELEQTLATSKLKEIVMFQDAQGYVLRLAFGDGESADAPSQDDSPEFIVVVKEKDAA